RRCGGHGVQFWHGGAGNAFWLPNPPVQCAPHTSSPDLATCMRLFRNRYLLLSDAVILASLPLLAYWVRFEGFNWSAADARALAVFTILVVPWKLGLFYIGGMYNRLWTQATVGDLVGIVRIVAISGIGATFLGALVLPGSSLSEIRVPLSVLLIDALATAAVVTAPRLLAKVTRTQSRALRRASDPATLIVGAGTAGETIAKETLANPRLGLRLIGFVDDDPVKQSLRLCGLPVLGSLHDIPALVQKRGVREMIIAIPEASGSVVRSVVRASTRAGVHTRIVPGMFEILSDKVSVSALRPVEIQDLLRREPVSTD